MTLVVTNLFSLFFLWKHISSSIKIDIFNMYSNMDFQLLPFKPLNKSFQVFQYEDIDNRKQLTTTGWHIKLLWKTLLGSQDYICVYICIYICIYVYTYVIHKIIPYFMEIFSVIRKMKS